MDEAGDTNGDDDDADDVGSGKIGGWLLPK